MTASPIPGRLSYIISREFTRRRDAVMREEEGKRERERERERREKEFSCGKACRMMTTTTEQEGGRQNEGRARANAWGLFRLVGALIGNFVDCRLQTQAEEAATRHARPVTRGRKRELSVIARESRNPEQQWPVFLFRERLERARDV